VKIVFFDGYCSLCNAFIDWLMRIDKTGQLKFASLQGETAAKFLEKIESTDVNTIIYLCDKNKFEQSTAVLHILSDVGGVWTFAKIFLIIPKFIRDFGYQVVAKNRYRFFKKRETCRVPTASEKDRLLL
jgi:predicted DCC family thiol-disulfide oxidoreductase YuxK